MNITRTLVRFALAMLTLTFTACDDSQNTPDMGGFYNDAGMFIRPVNTTFGSVLPPVFPSYVDYTCPNSSDTETLFCVSEDDSYESIGTFNANPALLLRIQRAFPRSFRERVVHYNFTPRDVTVFGYGSATPLDDDHWEIWVNTDPSAGVDRDFILEAGAQLLTVTIQANSVTEPANAPCGPFTAHVDFCPREDVPFRLWLDYWWDLQVDVGEWSADTDTWYASRSEQFVSRRAADSPVEDMAQTFAHFLGHLRPTGDTAVDQKADAFFYFADYMAVRGSVIREIGAP